MSISVMIKSFCPSWRTGTLKALPLSLMILYLLTKKRHWRKERLRKEKQRKRKSLFQSSFHPFPCFTRTVGRFLSSPRTSRTMKPINASSTLSQEKMTTCNRNWMLCMLHAVKRMLQCSTLMCDFVACSMLHCSIRLVGP